MHREAVCLMTMGLKVVFALSHTCLYPWIGEKQKLHEPTCKTAIAWSPALVPLPHLKIPAIIGPEKCTFFNECKSKNKNKIQEKKRNKKVNNQEHSPGRQYSIVINTVESGNRLCIYKFLE